MAIRELTPAQRTGFELAVRALGGIAWTDLPDHLHLPARDRTDALDTVRAITEVLRTYPHVILELTEHP